MSESPETAAPEYQAPDCSSSLLGLNRSVAELKECGIFLEGQTSLRTDDELKKVPAPPACKEGAKLASFERGVKEGLAGELFLYAVTSSEDRFGRTAPLSVVNPKRKACRDLKGGAAECCNLGFIKSLDGLDRHVASVDAESKSLRDQTCRAEYEQGVQDAAAACDPKECSARRMGIQYLGCYHLGYNTRFASCPKGTQVREFFQRNARGVFARSQKPDLGLGDATPWSTEPPKGATGAN